MDLVIIALLGLVVGNIIRQWLPFIRNYLTKDNVTWDSTYTRRFILSVGAAVGFAFANISQIIIHTSGVMDTFLWNVSIGVNMNWMIEEFSKWEWISATNRVEATVTPKPDTYKLGKPTVG